MDQIKKYLPFAAIAFAVIAVLMVFFPSIAVSAYRDESVNAFKTAFGSEDYYGFKFSFMNCLTWALLIGGIACLVLNHLNPDNKLFGYIAIGALFVAGIFFFCTLSFTQIDAPKKIAEELKKDFELGVGSIIAGICSLLAAICAAAPTAMDMLGIK